MMDTIRKHPIISGFIGLVALAIIIITVTLSLGGTKSGTNQPGQPIDPLQATTFTGALSQTTDSLLVNYGGTSDPSQDAVIQQFRILGADHLPLPKATADLLPQLLPKTIGQAIIPTYANTYVQVDKSSVQCPSQYDCRFSVYLDSPESYFAFHIYYRADGSLAYDFKQQPVPGVSQ